MGVENEVIPDRKIVEVNFTENREEIEKLRKKILKYLKQAEKEVMQYLAKNIVNILENQLNHLRYLIK